jgi:hypothetical protein
MATREELLAEALSDDTDSVNATEDPARAAILAEFTGDDADETSKWEAPAAADKMVDDGSNWLGRANAGLQGLTVGLADEIGTGIAAGAAKLAGSDESYGDIYSGMMDSEQAKRDEYTKNNAGESLALELAGGLATGIAGSGRLMAAKGLQNATKAKKLAALSGLGAAEGGIGGFATGDTFD